MWGPHSRVFLWGIMYSVETCQVEKLLLSEVDCEFICRVLSREYVGFDPLKKLLAWQLSGSIDKEMASLISFCMDESEFSLSAYQALATSMQPRLLELANEESVQKALDLYQSKGNGGELYMQKFGSKRGAFSFVGKGHGFGSIRSGKCGIVSMGHHFSSLGEISKFGFIREKGSSQDEKGAWLRLIDPFGRGGAGSVWSEVSLEYFDEHIKLSSRVENFGDSVNLFLVFFLQGDTLQIDQRVKTFGLLERYKGDVLPITLTSGNDMIKIIPEFDGIMEVIPLAGDDSYWGSNYLLAFALSEKEKQYKWFFS